MTHPDFEMPDLWGDGGGELAAQASDLCSSSMSTSLGHCAKCTWQRESQLIAGLALG